MRSKSIFTAHLGMKLHRQTLRCAGHNVQRNRDSVYREVFPRYIPLLDCKLKKLMRMTRPYQLFLC